MQEDYIVITENYEKQLVKIVNEKIQEGYQPYGNIVVSFGSDGKIKSYVQAMMLKAK